METLDLLPEISEKSDVILMQLMKVKAEMGSTIKKDATNPFHKSKYATLGAHLDLSEAILSKHGLLMLHAPNITSAQPILVATLHHPESGQWIKSYLPLPNPKSDSQGIGASITYMRRYSINSLLGLNAEDDDGETACGRGKYEKQAQKESIQSLEEQSFKISKTETFNIKSLIQQLDEVSSKSFFDWIKKTFKAESIQDIPKECYEKCIVSLNAKIKYLKDPERAIA